MKREKVDVSFTEFLYAVVVGASFNGFSTDLLATSNILLFLALIVITDDWVLYHAQIRNLSENHYQFAKRQILDVLILILWFFATLRAAVGTGGFVDYLFLLACFYGTAAIWEPLVLGIESRGLGGAWQELKSKTARGRWDFLAGMYLLLLGILFHFLDLSMESPLALTWAIPWFFVRWFAWRRLLFQHQKQ